MTRGMQRQQRKHNCSKHTSNPNAIPRHTTSTTVLPTRRARARPSTRSRPRRLSIDSTPTIRPCPLLRFRGNETRQALHRPILPVPVRPWAISRTFGDRDVLDRPRFSKEWDWRVWCFRPLRAVFAVVSNLPSAISHPRGGQKGMARSRKLRCRQTSCW